MRGQTMSKWIQAVAACVVVVGGLAIMGCTDQSANMFASGDVTLQKVNTDGVRVMWAAVEPKDTGVVVAGRIIPEGVRTYRYAGHVDVAYVDAAGAISEQGSSKTIYVLHRGPGTGSESKAFSIPVQAAPPAGSTVRVTYHRSEAH